MAKIEIKKKVSFDLEPSLIEELKKLSDLMQLKQSEFIRKAVEFSLLYSSKEIKIIQIKNDNLVERYVKILDIVKIENEEIANYELFNIKSKGTIYLKNDEIIKFISIFPLNNNTINKYIEIHTNIIQRLEKEYLKNFKENNPLINEIIKETLINK